MELQVSGLGTVVVVMVYSSLSLFCMAMPCG